MPITGRSPCPLPILNVRRGGTKAERDTRSARCRALTVRWGPGRWITSHDSPVPSASQAKWVNTTPGHLQIGDLAALTVKELLYRVSYLFSLR